MGNPPSLGRGISYERLLSEFAELGSSGFGDAVKDTEEDQESDSQQQQAVHVCLCRVIGTTQADDDCHRCEQPCDGAVTSCDGVGAVFTLEPAADTGNHAQDQEDTDDGDDDGHSSLFRS